MRTSWLRLLLDPAALVAVALAVGGGAGCAGGQEMIPPLPSGTGGAAGSTASGRGGGGGGGTTTTTGRGGGGGGAGTTGAGGGAGATGGGAISFSEDFEDPAHVAAGWIAGDANGTWKLVADGSSVYQATAASDETLVAGGDGRWTNQIVE